ncbi:MAG TPA: coproporphyrinogen III oxidase, partial [Myxococcales bacterium]|nr:coproporphyrinogen III oxidase [Myxococcales bacterium]
MSGFRTEAEAYFRDLRDRICARLEELDGSRFARRAWKREGGGGGEMSELRGALFEKGGCNFSAVWGDKYPAAVDPGSPAGGAPPSAPNATRESSPPTSSVQKGYD